MESTLQKPTFSAPSAAKASSIAYWLVTALFCLQMSFTAYAQLLLPQVADMFTHLGFPAYFRVELSWAKLIGVLLLLAEVMAEQAAPVPLLALLTHPLVRSEEGRAAWLDNARALDLRLRGPRPAPGLEPLRAIAEKARIAAWWQEAEAALAPLLAFDGVFVAVAAVFVRWYEEPTLRRLFGPAYAEYCASVGRWWPRRPTAPAPPRP